MGLPSQRLTKTAWFKIQSKDQKIRLKVFRSLASNFTSKPEVRKYIFTRDGNKCVICGSVENLQIDHKISAYQFSINFLPIGDLNSECNLQTLCRKCNSSKRP